MPLPASQPSRSGRITAATAALLLLFTPSAALAQRAPFVEQLTAFRMQLFGPYGDEGPRVVELLDRLSVALAAWDDDIRAERHQITARLATIDPEKQADDRMALAVLLAARGLFAEALQEIDAALVSAPQRPILHRFQGRLLEATGRSGEAAAAYRRAWDRDRTDAVSAYLTLSAVGIDPAVPDSPVIDTLFDVQRRSESLTSRSGFGPVRELTLVPDGASTTPLLPPAAYADGFELIARGNYREAIARFRAAVARDPLIVDRVSRTEPMSTGITRLRAGRMADAIAPLEVAASMFPASSEVHRILGTAHSAVGNDDQAVAHLRRALELAPDDERVRLAFGRALRDAGRMKEAAQSLREAIEILPRSAEARWMLAGVLERSGQGLEAARQLEAVRAGTVLAGRAVLLRDVAALYDQHQDFDRVIDLLRRRTQVRPNDPAVHKDLGLVQSRLGRGYEAVVELTMADLLGGGDVETLTALGQAHLADGRVTDAEAVLRRAIALGPDHPPARYALGRTLLRAGRENEAREQLQVFERLRTRAMDEQRRNFEIDKLRAEAVRQVAAGNLSQVALAWRQIVERMPDVLEFQVALADALVAVGDAERAATHLERAAKLGGGPAVQHRLAEVYARLGRRQESENARRLYDQQVRDALKAPDTARQ